MRILSLDGGGIRGIMPGQVLVALEEKLQKLSKNKDARIADYFDLIAGTSTGGILTCIYLCPSEEDATKARYSAANAVDLYLENGDEIFDVTAWQKISSGAGVFDEKYSAKELEESLNDYLGELKLSNLLKPCLVTSYDIRRRKAHFFKQHKAKTGDAFDFYVKDVARATSAAPTYFEAAKVKSMTSVPYPLVDGGVFANNPTLCAYAEARNLPGAPKAKDMFILSLGTGSSIKPYYYKEAKDWGLAQWVKPIIDIMMSGVSETVDFQLKQIFDAVGKPKQYVRIEPELYNASPEMDDASIKNLEALRIAGQKCADDNDQLLNDVAKKLIAMSPAQA
ncbi:patatin-like phospholipase family protein [Draconibacterium sp. IB214405]|uniref:patatin-like phospholipase family protein n=1 Tax=Draconibacterium sp. IB214405 TaxID=3097352 RepID=UPI002A13407B|nr:patatin-like phospholipase family protein [Draconibacterium sp. IB214405]MDX8338435.1 patatin-like phospholipase family protein [Draconibacterium sp. IB214405]